LINIFHNSHFHVINALTGKRNKLTFWCRWQLLPGRKDGSIQQGSKGRATARIPTKLTIRGSIWEALMKISAVAPSHPCTGKLEQSLSLHIIGVSHRAAGSETPMQQAAAAEPVDNRYTWGS